MITSLHNLTNEELISAVEAAVETESDLCIELVQRFTYALDEIDRLNQLLGAPE